MESEFNFPMNKETPISHLNFETRLGEKRAAFFEILPPKLNPNGFYTVPIKLNRSVPVHATKITWQKPEEKIEWCRYWREDRPRNIAMPDEVLRAAEVEFLRGVVEVSSVTILELLAAAGIPREELGPVGTRG